MPNHESAKKSVRQNRRRRLINRNQKGKLKSHIKNVIISIEEKDADKAKQFFSSAVSVIDRFASNGLIHKNNAARKKSRLWSKIRSLETSKTI
ncbi:30S ribosomal protein S20 [bacterium]|nr:30S ribosomal protein S20 [bacterium]